MVSLKGARLESTMQNIADAIVDSREQSFAQGSAEPSKTFVTLNNREKTISVAKKAYDGKAIFETPEGAFYDIVKENIKLLQSCNFAVPDYSSESEYVAAGPQPLFLYNPAVGPLYSIIRQKIRGGSLTKNSELVVDIAEVDMENVNLDGSLLICAESPLGKRNENGVVEYSDECGKCRLYNVSVQNAGIDRGAPNSYWQDKIERKGMLKISLMGNSEFEARDVAFTTPMEIIVPDGKRVIAKTASDGSIQCVMEDLGASSWHWNYAVNENADIILSN
jgi:hypothetical protein